MYSELVKGAEVTSEREKLAWLLAVFGLGLGLACGIGWYGASGKVRTVEKVVEKPAPAQRAANEKKIDENSNPLAYLPSVGVRVVVGEEGKDLHDARDLQNRIELRLRSHGITVKPAVLPGFCELQIEFITLWLDKDKTTFIYSCIAQHKDLLERTRMVGDPKRENTQLLNNMVTWQDIRTGGAGVYKAKDAMLTSLDLVVDSFANAYLAANPK